MNDLVTNDSPVLPKEEEVLLFDLGANKSLCETKNSLGICYYIVS